MKRLLALLPLALAGCWGAPPPAGLAPPADAPVVVFGDSLTAWGATTIAERWDTDHPDTPLSINAVGGAEAENWMPWMAQVGPGRCVIYALGTNDISRLSSHQAEWNALAALNELADAERVVALTLNETSGQLRGAPFTARTAHYNAFLEGLVADGTYPNLALADWSATSAGHPEWLTADHLHLTDPGTDAYAAELSNAGGLCP